MTKGPFSCAIFSAQAAAKSPSTARKTTSISRALSKENSSTTISPNPSVRTTLPADFAEANAWRLDVGKFRLLRTPRISMPTAPVTPTTPTLKPPASITVAVLRRLTSLSNPWKRRDCMFLLLKWGKLCRRPLVVSRGTNAFDIPKNSESAIRP